MAFIIPPGISRNPDITVRNTITPTVGTASALRLVPHASQSVGLFMADAAPPASANFGLMNIGSGGHTGGVGHYAGDTDGSGIAMNFAAGFAGDPLHIQVAGVTYYRIRNEADGSSARVGIGASPNAVLHLTKPAAMSNPPITQYLAVVGVADTAMTSGVEQSEVFFNLAQTRQYATGALTNHRVFKLHAPTLGFVGASTITNAATFYIDNAPTAGTNATITNAYALWVDAGTARFDGALTVGDRMGFPTLRADAWIAASANVPATVTNTSAAGMFFDPAFATTTTSTQNALEFRVRQQSAGGPTTVNNANGIQIDAMSVGTNWTVTNYADIKLSGTTGGSKNIGILQGSPPGSGNWNLYLNNALSSYLGTGSIGIGITSPSESLDISTVSSGRMGVMITGVSGQTADLQQWLDFEGKLVSVDPTGHLDFYRKSSTTVGRAVATIEASFAVNTDASRQGQLDLNVTDFNATRNVVRMEADGTNPKIGFLGAAAVARPAAFTLAGSATRTFPTDPSAAYTGIDNAQAGTVYAQVADLNTLRGVVSSLLGVVRQIVVDLADTSGYGLLND